MLKDALEFIFGQAEKSANPVPNVRKIGLRKRVVTLGGVTELETVDPPQITRVAHTLDSIAQLSSVYGRSPTAFVSEKGIIVVLDNDDRGETVTMRFDFSEQYKTFVSLAAGKTQRELIKTLRTKLAGCVDHATFVQILRQLEFDVNRGSRSEISSAKESLGRSIEKQVRANAGEMPEEVRVVIPLFSVPHDVPTEIVLNCAVTLEIDAEKIAIEATGDSLHREMKRVLTDITGRLDTLMPDGALVVFGEASIEVIRD